MGAVATLSRSQLTVTPGDEVTLDVLIRNTGSVVDQFTVEPLGVPIAWVRMEPQSLPLYPGAEGTITAHIAPPRMSTTAPGMAPFALRVVSAEDPAGNVVEEGSLEVTRFPGASAELLPRTSKARGRRAGRHDLAVDNRGNAEVAVRVTPVSVAEGELQIDVSPGVVTVRPGEASFLVVKVRGHKRLWRGSDIPRGFQVFAEPGDEPPIALEGSFVQQALLGRWVFKLLALILALALLLLVLYLTVLKPVIKSEANNAVASAVPSAAASAAQAQASKSTGGGAPASMPPAGGGGGASAMPSASAGAPASAAAPSASAAVSPSPVVSPSNAPAASVGDSSTVDPLGAPVAVRLSTSVPGFTVAAKDIYSLTDVIFQNPNGDSGTITLLRDGQVLLLERLDNFRDLDEHVQAPVEGDAGQVISVQINCTKPGSGAKACTPAALLSGFVRAAPAPTPSGSVRASGSPSAAPQP